MRDKLAEGAADADPLAAGGHTIRDYQPAAVPIANSRKRGPDRDLAVRAHALVFLTPFVRRPGLSNTLHEPT